MSQIGISRSATGFFSWKDTRLRTLYSGLSFPRERAAVMGVAAALALVLFDVALFLFDTPAHVRFIAEDGFLENLTVVLWLLGAAYILATLHRRSGWVLHLLLALAMILMAGEEISWGQRLFSFATPAGLNTINVQNEFNLHNIAGIHESIKNTGYVVIVLGTVLLPVLQRFSAVVNRLVVKFGIPLARADVMALVLLSMLLRVVSRTIWHVYHIDNAFDEPTELLLSLAFFLFALDRTPMRKLASQ